MGRRFTWVIVASVGGLLLIAGLDALRSLGGSEHSAPTASTSSAAAATSQTHALLPCDVEDLRISIVVRGGSTIVVARNFGDRCYRLLHGWHLRVEDRAGNTLVEWDEIAPLADGILPADSESSFGFSQGPIRCKSPGPYLASATVGPYFARRGHLSAGQVACVKARSAVVRREIERIGNEWASLFATDLQTCDYMSQPLCERIACERVGGIKIENCTPPTRAFRRSFEDATVEDVVIKDNRAAARFSNGQVVMIVYASALDTWFVHMLGKDAGRGFFE